MQSSSGSLCYVDGDNDQSLISILLGERHGGVTDNTQKMCHSLPQLSYGKQERLQLKLDKMSNRVSLDRLDVHGSTSDAGDTRNGGKRGRGLLVG